MADPDSDKGRMWIERTSDSGYFGRGDYVTFFFDFFHWQISKCKLTIVDGVQSRESTEEIERKVVRRRSNPEAKYPECPRYFSFVCRAKDMVDVAKKILETYEAFEKGP